MRDFAEIAQPKLVVLLGNTAIAAWRNMVREEPLEPKPLTVELRHPSWHLRNDKKELHLDAGKLKRAVARIK